MADNNAPTYYRAKEPLYSGWALAHTPDSEFVSNPAQIAANGWEGQVEKISSKNASPAVTGPVESGTAGS